MSITVVVYNSAHCLSAALASIYEDVLSGWAELIVINNASPDDSAATVAREFPAAKLINCTMNKGFAGGCNEAWNHVRGRYWLLLNPDVVVPQGALPALAAWMDEHPKLGAASPQFTDKTGKVQCAAHRFYSIPRSLVELLRLHLLLPPRLRSDFLLGSYWKSGDHLDVDWVPGAALIARCEAVESVGLLSERFFMYGEDIEWCWRMRKAGWRIGLCDRVRFQHQEGESALLTWGDMERSQRILRGVYDACRQMHGVFYTRLLIIVNALAHALESIHPTRSLERRRGSRKQLRLHLELLQEVSIKR